MKTKWLIYFYFLLLPVFVWGQDSIPVRKKISKKEAAVNVTKSLENKKSHRQVADDYILLAQELASQKDYAKAEVYFLQAANLYNQDKIKEKQAFAYRELAKTQELQQRFEASIKSYELAAKTTTRKEFTQINTNDANRLKSRNSLAAQSEYIESNIYLNTATQNKKDAALAYQQMAQVKLEMDDKDAAIQELESALDLMQETSEESTQIKEEIAKVYAADKQYDKAISINRSLVEDAQNTANPAKEVNQLQKLSKTYFEAKDVEKGISSLKQAYEIALQNNQTLEAKNILLHLTRFYKDKKQSNKAIEIYQDFVTRLDTLIKGDSTLVDEKIFQLHEDKIAQLEKERALKDELIVKKNIYNNMLSGFLILALAFVAIIAKSLYSINKKNKKIALQSLRREMNPHFIFNSLNSVNQFIAENNELEANKYLTSYSGLMRNIMENSNKDFISLTTEIDQLRKYLELEHLRFQDKFTYDIIINETLDADNLYIPNMLIQPQLENAIWHGLRYKETKGYLNLTIEPEEGRIITKIDDNGIGLANSKELKTAHQKQHNSRGLSNTRERIELLNTLYHLDISMKITDKPKEDSGVIVTLSFPVMDKKQIKDEHTAKNNKRNR